MIDYEQAEDQSFLSFIDVISCGLGADTLLFLVYGALPHAGVKAAQASTAAQVPICSIVTR